MIEILKRQVHYLKTITGISDVTACVILGEIGSIQRFERPEQLVAFAGLDASVHQSGDFNGSKTRLSKRGSPYLRRAIWQARSEEHTSELQSRGHLVCRLLLEKKNT